MNNFKVMNERDYQRESYVCTPARYVSYVGYYFIGYQRHGYGTGHHVRADLLERGDLTD
mgnify:CR=1 FL=1